MLRTGEDWDSQQLGNARSVIEINNHEIFRSPIHAISATKELEAHQMLNNCVKLIKLFERSVKTESHICLVVTLVILFNQTFHFYNLPHHVIIFVLASFNFNS